jgi:IS5 family transposase
MRLRKLAMLGFEWLNEGVLKIVRKRRVKYKRISGILDENPRLLTLVDRDLQPLSSQNRKGRKGDFTSENILRTMVVMGVEGESLRETVVLIAESGFLQDFVRLEKRSSMDFTFLDKCFGALSPETWKALNERLAGYAVRTGQADPSAIRTDTTVVEANIHYPTDASLLWDSWRVLARELRKAHEWVPESCPHRFHDRKVKRLFLFVTRYAASRSKPRQRAVRAAYRTLIERVRWISEIADTFCRLHRRSLDLVLSGVALDLEPYLPSVRTVLSTSERAQLRGETVPAAERVFSLFEPHTELIKRGKRSKPVEFGHVLLLSQTRQKLITDYQVFERRVPDCDLAPPVLERHEKLYGAVPPVFAADKGFSPRAEVRAQLAEVVETLAIPRRTQDFADEVMVHWQNFRAGIEGSISALKRVFRLFRCFSRGFKHFASAVGLGVFSHNLVVLASSDS